MDVRYFVGYDWMSGAGGTRVTHVLQSLELLTDVGGRKLVEGLKSNCCVVQVSLVSDKG